MKRILALLLTGTLLIVSACAAPAGDAASPTPNPAGEAAGEPASDPAGEASKQSGAFTFSAVTVEGEPVTEALFSIHPVTMVNVWATFCGPCLSEMPDLGDLSQEYAAKGLSIVGVVGDVGSANGTISEADYAAVEKIIQDTGASYTHLLPSGDAKTLFLDKTAAYPTTYFVDSNGKTITQPIVGSRSRDQWVSILDEVLSGIAELPEQALSPETSAEEGASSAPNDIPLSDNLFASFFGTDLDGNTVDASWFGDSDMVLLLVWNGADEALTQEAFSTVEAYSQAHPEDYDALRFAGLMLDAETMDSARLEAVKAASPLTLLTCNEALHSYFSGTEAGYYAIAPWGQVAKGPAAAGATDADIQGFLSESFFAFYLSDCCSE